MLDKLHLWHYSLMPCVSLWLWLPVFQLVIGAALKQPLDLPVAHMPIATNQDMVPGAFSISCHPTQGRQEVSYICVLVKVQIAKFAPVPFNRWKGSWPACPAPTTPPPTFAHWNWSSAVMLMSLEPAILPGRKRPLIPMEAIMMIYIYEPPDTIENLQMTK